jgi:hypothetical protein
MTRFEEMFQKMTRVEFIEPRNELKVGVIKIYNLDIIELALTDLKHYLESS